MPAEAALPEPEPSTPVAEPAAEPVAAAPEAPQGIALVPPLPPAAAPRLTARGSLWSKPLAKLPLSDPLAWWPVLLGLVLGLASPRLGEYLADSHPLLVRLVYPFVLLAGRRELGLSEELTQALPRVLVLAQFPLEGLLSWYSLRRGAPLRSAALQLVGIHLGFAVVLGLVAGSLF